MVNPNGTIAHISTVVLALFCRIAVGTAGEPVCYYKSGGTVVVQPLSKWVPCKNSTVSTGACCYIGSECGEDSICHFTQPSAADKDWFVGGCTDPSWQDPACSNHCTSYLKTDIQYNSTSQLWSCCGDSVCNGNVTDESFSAISPQKWSAVSPTMSMSASTASPMTTPTTTLATAAGSNSPPTNHNDGSGLSGGDIAGIVVACSVVGLGALITLVVLLLRRSKSAKEKPGEGCPETAGEVLPVDIDPNLRSSVEPYEDRSTSTATEMDGEKDARAEADSIPLAELDSGRQSTH